MVKIRLRRVGKKKQPIYKVVTADSRASRNGKIIEDLGQYNPLLHPIFFDVNETRLFTWLKNGAQPTDTVRSLLQRKGLWLKWSLVKQGADETKVAQEMEKWNMLQADKLQREDAKKIRRKEARKKKAAASSTETPKSAPPTEVAAEAAPAA